MRVKHFKTDLPFETVQERFVAGGHRKRLILAQKTNPEDPAVLKTSWVVNVVRVVNYCRTVIYYGGAACLDTISLGLLDIFPLNEGSRRSKDATA